MVKRGLIVLYLAGILLLAACELAQPTGQSANDPQAAQSFFPVVAGYSTQSTDNVQSAITTALGGASLLTGNPVQAALVAQVDNVMNCYKEVGALESRIYMENLSNLDAVRVPIAGVLAVVNQDRLRENFLACVSRTPLDGMFRSQAVQPEPCFGSGTFTSGGNTISYIFAATDRPLCSAFETHFSQFR